jgi:hypothetical protein
MGLLKLNFTKKNESFGSRFDIDTVDIPKDYFAFYYFDNSLEEPILYRTIVPQVRVEFGMEGFNGIAPENFSAYWKGMISVDYRQELKMVSSSIYGGNSTGILSLYIDNEQIVRNDEYINEKYFFSRADHAIEVEFNNDQNDRCLFFIHSDIMYSDGNGSDGNGGDGNGGGM